MLFIITVLVVVFPAESMAINSKEPFWVKI
jgi:hypothetical protein